MKKLHVSPAVSILLYRTHQNQEPVSPLPKASLFILRKEFVDEISKNHFYSIDGCGKDLHSKARHGNVFSPHWPLPYPNYVDCVWHIITGPRLHVKLIFYDFDVRLTHLCEVDFVKVNTGGKLERTVHRFCGSKHVLGSKVKKNRGRP